jgi:exodeoxyribonuclease-3
VNSVRQRLHQLQSVVDKHSPEFIGLQETKVQDHEFPVEAIAEMGYQTIYAGQKTHYGVAMMSRLPCSKPRYGFPGDSEDAQKRFIGGEYQLDGQSVLVFNGYFPQGESRDHPIKFPAKQRFYDDLIQFLGAYDMTRSNLIVMGDYNIAYTTVSGCVMPIPTTVLAGSITVVADSSANQKGDCASIICWFRSNSSPEWSLQG